MVDDSIYTDYLPNAAAPASANVPMRVLTSRPLTSPVHIHSGRAVFNLPELKLAYKLLVNDRTKFAVLLIGITFDVRTFRDARRAQCQSSYPPAILRDPLRGVCR